MKIGEPTHDTQREPERPRSTRSTTRDPPPHHRESERPRSEVGKSPISSQLRKQVEPDAASDKMRFTRFRYP